MSEYAVGLCHGMYEAATPCKMLNSHLFEGLILLLACSVHLVRGRLRRLLWDSTDMAQNRRRTHCTEHASKKMRPSKILFPEARQDLSRLKQAPMIGSRLRSRSRCIGILRSPCPCYQERWGSIARMCLLCKKEGPCLVGPRTSLGLSCALICRVAALGELFSARKMDCGNESLDLGKLMILCWKAVNHRALSAALLLS